MGSKLLFRNDAEQRLVAHDCETVNVAVMRMMWKRHRAKLLVFPLAMFVALNDRTERQPPTGTVERTARSRIPATLERTAGRPVAAAHG